MRPSFASASTYQRALQAVARWDRIGILEPQSQLDEAGVVDDPVPEWPFNVNPPDP